MEEIVVRTSKTYAVSIADGLLDRVGAALASLGGVGKALVVTDGHVAPLYADRAESSVREAGIEAAVHVFPAGEASKTPGTLLAIVDRLASLGLTATDAVVALGGGVVGDVAGLAAALYLRGVRLVQVPTTLLAMVDSSVGGKTAVNLPSGKNLMGAFYQPDAVLCDPSLTATLPVEVFADGCAEVVKYAFIDTPELLALLRSGPVRDRLESVVAQCVGKKRDLVVADEHDRGERHFLNLGHTIGHAIEKASGFAIGHGHAVAAGMVIAAEGAWACGWASENAAPAMRELLLPCGLPVSTPYSADELLPYLVRDKKRTGGTILLVVPERPGHCVLRDVPVSELRGFVEKGLAACK